jgi:hypothetical protein
MAGAGEVDAGAVGEESAALGRGRTRRTTRGDRPVDGGSLLKGVAGDSREGGSGSGDATRRWGDVGPGSDRGGGAPLFWQWSVDAAGSWALAGGGRESEERGAGVRVGRLDEQ